MKRVLMLVLTLFAALAIFVGCKTGNVDVTEDEKVKVKFEVEIPELEEGDYTFVIFGSFSEWKLLSKNTLTKNENKYEIELELEKNKSYDYKYAILGDTETDTSKVEKNSGDSEVMRSVQADESKTISDQVARFAGVKLASEVVVAKEYEITFNVTVPELISGEYTFVIYGSFSNWKVLSENALVKNGDNYSITLKFKEGAKVEYKYAVLGENESDKTKVEKTSENADVANRVVDVDMAKTVNDTVARFNNVKLASEAITHANLLDNKFFDNDGGSVHTLVFEDNILKVSYSKAEGKSWACIIRDLEDDVIGKLDSITFTFKGEKDVEYLFKVQNGDAPQEETVVGTGEVQEYTMKINSSARNSRKLVIFGHKGQTGTTSEPITGSYELHSIVATLKEPEPEPPYVPGDNPIHILAIGNSFSDDGLWLLYQILKDLGYDDIVVANLYIGGCTVATHKGNLQNDRAAYTYRVNKDGSWVSKDGYKASIALAEWDWDFISLQQASNYSGLESYYVASDIDYIYNYAYEIAKVKNPDVKFVWQMTWAYQQNSTHSAFVNYNKDQMTMYNGIINATQKVIASDQYHPIIVPSGTAIQNLRTSFLGDTITRDGYHLNEGFGRYTAALTWAIMLTGKDITEVSAPAAVIRKTIPLCKEAAKNACLKPYEVTESEFKEDEEVINIDLSNMDILDQSEYIIGNGYYNSQDSSKFMTPIQDGSSFCNGFITTKLFTPDDLPIGSVIVLGSGYQYRPEGWIDEARQASRNPNTTEAQVVVTSDWWANYIYRAFNISKVGGGVLTEDAYTDALAHFTIYVPKSE